MFEGVLNAKGFLARQYWTLQRFGLSPGKVQYRFLNQKEPRILCVSIPKAGTHLLERALCLHPRLYRRLVPTVNDNNIKKWGGLDTLLAKLRPGQIIISHLHFTSDRVRIIESRKTRSIFLIRDPRDLVISQAFYITANKRHRLNKVFRAQKDLKSRIRLSIKGYPSLEFPSIAQRLEKYTGWLESGCLVVRFEDLVGPQGGSSRDKQLYSLQSIYTFIQLDADRGLIDSLCRQLFSDISPTFRVGAIGQWKHFFDPEIKDLFKKIAGRILIQYGYEQYDQW